jgi:hypothetical protein
MTRSTTFLNRSDDLKSFDQQKAEKPADPHADKAAPLPVRRLRVSGERPTEDPEVSRTSQGKRLLEARLKNGYRTASDAARALQIAGPTYLAHENGTRQIRPDIAAFYARQFAISTEWLLFGRGNMSSAEAAAPGEPRSVAATAPQPTTAEAGGMTRLLLALKVQRVADGGFVRQDGSDGPGQLPPINLTDGYVAELAQPHGDPSECLVSLSDGPEPGSLALRDILRIPTDMIERSRLFAVKMPGNLLLKDMPGGQRAFVDPDDIEVDDEGLFMVSTGPRGLLVPMYVSQSGMRDKWRIARSQAKPPVLVAASEVRLVGRIVMQFRAFGEAEVRAVAESLLTTADR